MALSAILLGIAGYTAASRIIDFAGGDPEGGIAEQTAQRQALTSLQQAQPLNRARQQLASEQEVSGNLAAEASDFGTEATEVGLGRPIEGGRELLERISRQIGSSPEDLSARLSPTRSGDYSSLSKAAFGRSSKKLEQ